MASKEWSVRPWDNNSINGYVLRGPKGIYGQLSKFEKGDIDIILAALNRPDCPEQVEKPLEDMAKTLTPNERERLLEALKEPKGIEAKDTEPGCWYLLAAIQNGEYHLPAPFAVSAKRVLGFPARGMVVDNIQDQRNRIINDNFCYFVDKNNTLHVYAQDALCLEVPPPEGATP